MSSLLREGSETLDGYLLGRNLTMADNKARIALVADLSCHVYFHGISHLKIAAMSCVVGDARIHSLLLKVAELLVFFCSVQNNILG